MPAQQVFVYPAKGQSADQQKIDEGECHVWAVQQSKYDPAKPPSTAAAKAPATASGTTPGAGVRGAARGAIVGEIVARSRTRGHVPLASSLEGRGYTVK